MVTIEDFQKLDIRVGKIIDVEYIADATYTTHKLTIDFGDGIGEKISGTRLVKYSKEQLTGRLILAVINLQPRQIGKLISEALVSGVPGQDGECVLIEPERDVELGGRLY